MRPAPSLQALAEYSRDGRPGCKLDEGDINWETVTCVGEDGTKSIDCNYWSYRISRQRSLCRRTCHINVKRSVSLIILDSGSHRLCV